MTNVLSATLDFADVAAAWKGFLDGSMSMSAKNRPAVATQIVVWESMPEFTGMERAEMARILDQGYRVPGMKLKGRNTRQRRKLRYSEEAGEFQYDRAEIGEDLIYIDRTPRKNAQRAVKLEIELAVRADTPASVLGDYAIWLGKLITGLEGGGFQTQVDVVSRCRGLVIGSRAQFDTHIRVKSFGKRGSKRSWSALLSPGGFRHLVFCARMLGCEQAGVQCSPGMGASFGPTWDLNWDRKQRKLTVKCAATTGRFPADEMDRKLAQIKF